MFAVRPKGQTEYPTKANGSGISLFVRGLLVETFCMKLWLPGWSILLLITPLIGCGQPMPGSDQFASDLAGNEESEALPSRMRGEGPVTMSTGEVPVTSTSGQADLPVRKIIYTAAISLVVDNFDGLEQRIQETVEQHQGYLSRATLDRMQGESRRGIWQARIPVDQYDAFLQAVVSLGVPTSLEQNAQDVSEEFVDLNARLDNKRKLESRILELLDRPGDEIQHVIDVERELARVREEIERMQGRLRFLTDQTTLTTVDISAREERDYQPPQAPTLGNRIALAWNNSLQNTSRFFQDALVTLVAHAIAIVAWVVGLVIAWLGLRTAWRRIRGHSPGSAREY